MMGAVKVRTLAVALTILSATSAAWADDQSCISAYEQTQTLRKASKLRDARDEASKCAQESCPAVLRADCTKWLSELEASVPTVVFEVKGSAGEELTSVKVTMDGAVLVEKLDGRAAAIDPGKHVFKFETADGKAKPFEQTIVIHEGDRGKRIPVTMPTEQKEGRPIPTAAIVFGAAAILGIGGGAFFAIRGSGQQSDLDACKPACDSGAINDASQSYAIADILLTAGIVSAVAAVYLYVTRPAGGSSSSAGLVRPVLRF